MLFLCTRYFFSFKSFKNEKTADINLLYFFTAIAIKLIWRQSSPIAFFMKKTNTFFDHIHLEFKANYDTQSQVEKYYSTFGCLICTSSSSPLLTSVEVYVALDGKAEGEQTAEAGAQLFSLRVSNVSPRLNSEIAVSSKHKIVLLCCPQSSGSGFHVNPLMKCYMIAVVESSVL